jgi:GAF domain-containing protein
MDGMGPIDVLADRIRVSLAEEAERACRAYSGGEALGPVLGLLLAAVEVQFEGQMLASILLLDDEGKRLRHGAAPSLPSDYCAAIDGVAIGPKVGSCGTAAYLGHPIYVTDIESDPLWADFRELAAKYDLRACWSTPIKGRTRPILGTFAIYYRTPRSPTPDELLAIRHIVQITADTIERCAAA